MVKKTPKTEVKLPSVKIPKVKFTLKFNQKTKKILVFVLVFIGVSGLIYQFKSWLVVSVINNHPITRFAFDRELERMNGQQVLDNMVAKTLILQKAKKDKINITQDQIDAELKKIEEEVKAQGGTLDDLLSYQGMTRDSLNEQVKIQLIIDQILGKDIQISDDEAKTYFDSNKDYYPENTKFEDVKDQVVETLRQQKIGEKFQTWLDSLKKEAKIYNFTQF